MKYLKNKKNVIYFLITVFQVQLFISSSVLRCFDYLIFMTISRINKIQRIQVDFLPHFFYVLFLSEFIK